MRLFVGLLFLVSFPAFSVQLVCDLGEYDLIVDTNKESCSGGDNSQVALASGRRILSRSSVSCNVHVSTQNITREVPEKLAPVLTRIGYVQFDFESSDSVLHMNNDQGIGYNRGISTFQTILNGEDVEFEFNFLEDCRNVDGFIKDFFEIPDAPANPS